MFQDNLTFFIFVSIFKVFVPSYIVVMNININKISGNKYEL